MTTATTDLVLFAGPGETLSDRLAAAAQARVLVDLVKDAQKHADTALRDTVDSLSEQTGTAFTARGDGQLAGWSAQITAPQPKPVMSDREAFGAWWEEQGWPCETVTRVEIADEIRALEGLGLIDDGIRALEGLGLIDNGDLLAGAAKLADALSIFVEHILPESAAEQAVKMCVPHPDGHYVYEDTGEVVPGLEWRQQAPQLRVVGSKDAKAAGRHQVCELLGINPAALDGGA